jgi:hypothetical protein
VCANHIVAGEAEPSLGYVDPIERLPGLVVGEACPASRRTPRNHRAQLQRRRACRDAVGVLADDFYLQAASSGTTITGCCGPCRCTGRPRRTGGCTTSWSITSTTRWCSAVLLGRDRATGDAGARGRVEPHQPIVFSCCERHTSVLRETPLCPESTIWIIRLQRGRSARCGRTRRQGSDPPAGHCAVDAGSLSRPGNRSGKL